MEGTNNYILLMTSCISPQLSGQPVTRYEPDVRLNDYLIALTYWLRYEDARIRNIIIVENSGYSLTSLKNTVKKHNKFSRNIEFVQYEETNQIENVHYGYYEYAMLDYVIENSNIIRETDYIIKVTGRLTFPNLNRLIGYHAKHNFDFLSDCREYSILNRFKNYSILTTLFIYQVKFYKNQLMGKKSQMVYSKNYYLENVLYTIISPQKKQNNIQIRFPFNVEPVGVGGHNNDSYQSFGKRVKANVRGLTRLMLPNYHI